VAIALGYGRVKAGRSGNNIGQNVFPMLTSNGETTIYFNPNVTVTNTEKLSI
jgi:hypothetical protein